MCEQLKLGTHFGTTMIKYVLCQQLFNFSTTKAQDGFVAAPRVVQMDRSKSLLKFKKKYVKQVEFLRHRNLNLKSTAIIWEISAIKKHSSENLAGIFASS